MKREARSDWEQPERNRGFRQRSGDDADAASPDVMREGFLPMEREPPLPFGWEKCLNIKTGDFYYRDSSTGMSTPDDPRIQLRSRRFRSRPTGTVTDVPDYQDRCRPRSTSGATGGNDRTLQAWFEKRDRIMGSGYQIAGYDNVSNYNENASIWGETAPGWNEKVTRGNEGYLTSYEDEMNCRAAASFEPQDSRYQPKRVKASSSPLRLSLKLEAPDARASSADQPLQRVSRHCFGEGNDRYPPFEKLISVKIEDQRQPQSHQSFLDSYFHEVPLIPGVNLVNYEDPQIQPLTHRFLHTGPTDSFSTEDCPTQITRPERSEHSARESTVNLELESQWLQYSHKLGSEMKMRAMKPVDPSMPSTMASLSGTNPTNERPVFRDFLGLGSTMGPLSSASEPVNEATRTSIDESYVSISTAAGLNVEPMDHSGGQSTLEGLEDGVGPCTLERVREALKRSKGHPVNMPAAATPAPSVNSGSDASRLYSVKV